MILIVGLGNPGAKYKRTYHNVGFDVVDELAKRLKVRFCKRDCDARLALGEWKGEKFVLAKPETYMNNSGEAVRKLVRKFDVDPARDLVVCYDDVDLPIGKLRLREAGSSGTHNGMRSVVAELGSEEFFRLRVGTRSSRLEAGELELLDFVLAKISYDDLTALAPAYANAVDALVGLVERKDLARLQEKLNRH